jgi:hypothetical protein
VTAELTKGQERSFPAGARRIELTTPIKLYFLMESGFDVTVTEDDLMIEFGDAADVAIGARTHHYRPAATVTTTADPEDLMRAVSAFGSALKTTSCERSYPTLRGHPPAIEYGDELDLPDVLDVPETGITIEVPPELGAVYAVSSLAYYLGATVVSGADPLVRTDTGFVHRLDGTSRGFEEEVERVLKQCLFLDCVTRTEGYYPVDLHERDRIEDEVSLDFPRLYGRPLAEQFEAYLGVSYGIVEPHVPRWRLTAHVEPEPPTARALPYVARELAAIRSRSPAGQGETVAGTAAALGIDEFVRERGSDRPGSRERAGVRREAAVRIDGTDAFEDMWIGDGVPVGASKGMIEAFRNRVTRTPSDGDIDITVVVNDAGMTDESSEVNEVYGSRDALPFDVTVAEHLSTRELEAVLRSETDFLHYIGHIDEEGFECSDGMFDAGELAETGVDAFFLNACDSYRQGKRLVEAGSIAGVATLTPVPNDQAEAMGKKLARLLNRGFPLYAALDVLKLDQRYSQYISIGDSNFNIVQAREGVATLYEIENMKARHYTLSYITYPTKKCLIGSMTIIFAESKHFLTSGSNIEFEMEKSQFESGSIRGELPVIKNKRIHWDL